MTNHVAELPRLLRLPEVEAATGLKRSQIFRLEQTSDFPARRSIGPRAVAWIESEVAAWIERRPKKALAQRVAA